MKKLVAISGGIGSGKSVVSDVLRVMGFPVYDCDAMAKSLMDNSPEIKAKLKEVFGDSVVQDGIIDRKQLAGLVFGNGAALEQLNGIVHPAVVNDVLMWYSAQESSLSFVETAILKESGLVDVVDAVLAVCADKETRISRVERRNGLTRKAVLDRMAMQNEGVAFKGLPVYSIDNNGDMAIIPQIDSLLRLF